jgi:hypothetical protein
MLSTSIGVQFNVNDLDANYEVVGTSDNYSFQYDLGKGNKIADFEGETIQKVISLEGNYGNFDVRVYAVSDIGVRSAFIETGISISPPRFDSTFTFSDLRITNLPDDANVGSVINYEPQYPGDKLEVESEYVNKNVQISWALIPPVGHAKEGESVTTELLNDTFFEKFEIILENGQDGNVIASNVLAESPGMQDSLLTADVAGLLSEYREFSIELNDAAFEDLDLERNIGIKIISHDSFGGTATGILTGINYQPQVEGLSYSLRGSDMDFSWFSNDTDFSGVRFTSLALPSTEVIKYPYDLDASIEYYLQISGAGAWNLGRSEYRSGDMVSYADLVYQAKSDITLDVINNLGRQNTSPLNNSLWDNLGPKVTFDYKDFDVFTETLSASQVWGYSYYYAFQPFDGYGSVQQLNLTEAGLEAGGYLRPFTSEVKIGSLRYRERSDDLIFNWEIVDQDANLVDIEQYRFALSNADVPSLLGVSGSLFDSDTKNFLTGITQGNSSKISSIDEFGNRTVIYDLPNTQVFDTYEFTREVNNALYGVGGFPQGLQNFDPSSSYNQGDSVLENNSVYNAILGIAAGARPSYELWQSDNTYSSNDIIEYQDKLYKVDQEFGPDSNSVIGVYDTGVNYNIGDLIIFPNFDIYPYFLNQEYLAGDVVFYNQTIYLSLRNQSAGDNVVPGENRVYWKVLSLFDDIESSIYKAVQSNSYTGSVPSQDTLIWQSQNPSTSDKFSLFAESFPYDVQPWLQEGNYNSGSFVLYNNDIWVNNENVGPGFGNQSSPVSTSTIWSNTLSGQDIVYSASLGDYVYNGDSLYKAIQDNPPGGLINAELGAGDEINSTYNNCGWSPFWERDVTYDSVVFNHQGIPESGKRSIGLEVGIVDNKGQVLSSQKIIGINQEPSILPQGFQVDSLEESTKVKFNFNYAFGSQEKTSKVHVYRSENQAFEITGIDGLPYDTIGGDSSLVKVVLGSADATFGENITQIIDEPPIPQIDGIDQITGYYYKLLPFDDFGSGDIYNVLDNQGVLERVLVYPKNYSHKNPNGLPGPVYRTSSDDIPGVVTNLTGEVAFENFFLSWQHPSGQINDVDNIPNDLSHYEVWVSEQDKLELGSLGSEVYLKSQADPSEPVDFSNDRGYRRIETDISSTGPIPIELQDPANGITNATKAFNISANGNEVETSYFGTTNETKYFWVRAVDFAGNKSPFTGAANLNTDFIEGLGLTLGQASATDIDDFELNMTETFGNTIALAPDTDPFFDQDGSYVSWPDHVLYHNGTGYLVNGSGIGPNYDISSAAYIWWDNNQSYQSADPVVQFNDFGLRNVLFKNVDYKVSSSHPAGGNAPNGNYINADPDFDEGDFIVSRIVGFPSLAKATPVYHAFSNALIGTANIAEAAIIDAKINSLKADKITAGEIKGHEIIVGSNQGQYGSIASPGFDGYVNPVDGTVYNAANKGFAISGDGTFEFRSDQGKMSLDSDGTLSLEGRLRQSDGTPYDFIDLNASPSFFNYNEIEDPNNQNNSILELASTQDSIITASFRNSNIEDDEVLFRMAAVSNTAGILDVFDYNDWRNRSNYEISGLRYDYSLAENFEIDGAIRHAKGSFDPSSFDSIVSYYNADSIILFCSGQNNNYETTTTISRVVDGQRGVDGPGTSYQGDWSTHSTSKVYYSTRERADIVRYNNNYYIAKQTHTRGTTFLTSNWNDFGATFSSVATSLLLTEQGYVTDTLTVGDANYGGKIIANGFDGGFDANGNHQTEDYDPAGFRIERTDGNNPTAIFDIGGLGPNGTPSYIRFSSQEQKVEIRGGFTNNSVASDIGFSSVQSNDPQAIFIGAGYDNEIFQTSTTDSFQSLASSIVGGAYNEITGRFSFIGNGYANSCGDNFSAVVAGYNNSMPKVSNLNEGANFIGAGQNNIINGGTNQSIIGGSNNTIQN